MQGFLGERRLILDLGRRRMLQMAQGRVSYRSEACEDQGRRGQKTERCGLRNDWEGRQRKHVPIFYSSHLLSVQVFLGPWGRVNKSV